MRSLVIAMLLTAAPALADAPATTGSAVSRDELLRHLVSPDSFVLVDARSEDEYAQGHLAGAANVPHNRLEDHRAALPDDPDVPLVVYCSTGKRAGLLAEQLRAAGYHNVRTLRPDQIFWSDGLAVFNCAADAAPDAALHMREER